MPEAPVTKPWTFDRTVSAILLWPIKLASALLLLAVCVGILVFLYGFTFG